MVVGTHHMLLPICKVLLGATSHATGDVLPLNSVAPPACCAPGEAGCHGGAHRGAELAGGHRVTAVACHSPPAGASWTTSSNVL